MLLPDQIDFAESIVRELRSVLTQVLARPGASGGLKIEIHINHEGNAAMIRLPPEEIRVRAKRPRSVT